MTLTITTAEDDQRQLSLTIEIDEARVRKAMQVKARELGKDVQLPGFRPGKAPYDVIVRRIGEETLRVEAIEDLAQPVFEEALEKEGIEPYARPTLDDIELEPAVLKFTVPLEPTVVLGDYRSIREEVEQPQVTDEALEEALEYVRMRHQVVETVDRPAGQGDIVSISGSGKFTAAAAEGDGEEAGDDDAAEGDTIFEEERMEILLDAETLFPNTPFTENVIGMTVGDQKSFSITFPDPYELDEEYAGREATFDITVLEVKSRTLPELDDNLAQQEGDYETMDEMREGLRADLLRQAEDASREKVIDDMLHHLIEGATMVFPPAAIDAQIDEMVENFKNQLSRTRWKFEDYLAMQGMTEETLRQDFSENAESQLRHQLALRQFILDEKLRITEADVDKIIEDRVARFENEGLRESMRNYFRSGEGFDGISSEVLLNKSYERILAILSGNAPDLDALEDEDDDEEE